jgi:hypothetical protein
LYAMRDSLELARRRCVDAQKCDVPPAIAALTAVRWSVPPRLAVTLEAALRAYRERDR